MKQHVQTRGYYVPNACSLLAQPDAQHSLPHCANVGKALHESWHFNRIPKLIFEKTKFDSRHQTKPLRDRLHNNPDQVSITHS